MLSTLTTFLRMALYRLICRHALSVNGGTGGVLQLPESNITDEEIHALAALLRNNTSIDELNLRGKVSIPKLFVITFKSNPAAHRLISMYDEWNRKFHH